MAKLALALALGIAAVAAIGCAPSQDKPEAAAPGVQVAQAAVGEAAGEAAAAPAKAAPEIACAGGGVAGACGEAAVAAAPAAGEGEHKVETGCGDYGATAALTNTAERAVTKADGTQGLHIGSDFAAPEVVKVSQLLADPLAFKGKTVRVEGDVSAMCQHKRGWFSVVAEDKSGGFVRVTTTPAFLVPRGSVGKFARAEGRVEVIEVAANHARHLAKEHQLGDPAEIAGNIHQVVIRAAGAEFF